MPSQAAQPGHRRPDAGPLDPRIERSRRVIRQAALAELADAGYGAFAIESVASRAGVGKSTIYRHWHDKLDLIADAFETAHEHMVPDIATGTARERVTRLVEHVAEVAIDPTFSRCIPALVEGAERDPRLREFQGRFAAIRRKSLVEAIAAGVAAGEFAPGTDAELATFALLGAVFYGRLMSAGEFEPRRAGALVDAVLPVRAAPAQRPESGS
jgi:TetR/AcrR family transcriptional regulator, regulator of autoinduction and epiphytic fitness